MVTQRSFFLLFIIGLWIGESAYAQVDFREETIYFLITTRFFDGDPSNNVPNEWSSYHPDPNINPSITDPNDVTWRGDFKGLIQQLDYIKDLGFTAIWITPIVHNRSPLDYHGYHAWDFTRVDPRLESPGATFQDLINEVHARDMKIVLDIVTNHSGRFGIKDVAELKYNTDPNRPWGQDSDGNPLQDNPDWEYDGITPNPDDGKIWSRANLAKLPAPYNENLAAYNFPNSITYVQTSSNDWFHHSGNGFAQGYDSIEDLWYRALHEDTPDLNTGSPYVREYLVEAYRTFIEMGVDGFRWDTVKHMSHEDVYYFYDAFKEINPDLFIFAEVTQKRHELHDIDAINPHAYTWRPNGEPSDLAIIDFFAMATFHLFEKGEGMSGVMAAARYDHLYSNPSTNVTFLDNHDFGPNNDWNRRFGNNAENLTAAMNFMFTWRGIPSVYYGTEIQFMRGAYADIQYGGHQRSIDETGRAYFGDHIADAPNHKVYQHIRKLNAMRRAIPALQKGDWRWAGNGGHNGVGYIREYSSGQTDSYVVVGLAKDQSVAFNFTGIRNGIYRDAVTGHEVEVTGGNLRFTVSPSSAGIYVLNGPGLIGDLGAGFFQSTASGDGSGGGGGGSQQGSVNWTPQNPTADDKITITISDVEQGAVLHWAVNGWTQPNQTYWPSGSQLDGSGPAVRTPFGSAGDNTLTLEIGPFNNVAQMVSRLDFVINYADGSWDNNNSNDYRITINSSGEQPGPDPDADVYWMPGSPTVDQEITVVVRNTNVGAKLHWAVNGWTQPHQNYWPAGSELAGSGPAVRTPFTETEGDSLILNIGPFNSSSQSVTEINFVISFDDGNWDNNNNNDYRIVISTAPEPDPDPDPQPGEIKVVWNPTQPQFSDALEILVINPPSSGKLHWGVNSWQQPNQVYWPSGTAIHQAGPAVQSPLQAVSDDTLRILVGPFNNPLQTVTEINFVVSFDDGTWENNNETDYTVAIGQPTSSDSFDSEIPDRITLHANYPNPFNPVTEIRYDLNETTDVRLVVFDMLGRQVAILQNGMQAAGSYNISFDASHLSSGVYLYRLEAGTVALTRRMTLVK